MKQLDGLYREANWTAWVSIPSRGFWFFEAARCGLERGADPLHAFQSPRGDFGFLKLLALYNAEIELARTVSIPSRGFWFFEDADDGRFRAPLDLAFQSPRGDFGFLKQALAAR